MIDIDAEEDAQPVVDLGAEWDFAPAPWMKAAACGDHDDPELFHPSHDRDVLRLVQAKSVCLGCPVKDDCLQYAISENIWHGIWGGLTVSERHALRRRTLMTRRG